MSKAKLYAGVLLIALAACSQPKSSGNAEAKIQFDLSTLNDDGLQGPPDGLRSLSYEFCIPASKRAEVAKLDPTIGFSESPGRIGCTQGQLLCIGNTHQPRFREVLFELASLSYVTEIREVFFE